MSLWITVSSRKVFELNRERYTIYHVHTKKIVYHLQQLTTFISRICLNARYFVLHQGFGIEERMLSYLEKLKGTGNGINVTNIIILWKGFQITISQVKQAEIYFCLIILKKKFTVRRIQV